MRTYTDVFIHDDDEVTLTQLETGMWNLRYDTLGIFLTDEQVKNLAGAIGRIYWDLPMELVDPEEEYVESI
jgi:hypothetical protein